jgi:hypothetical protein
MNGLSQELIKKHLAEFRERSTKRREREMVRALKRKDERRRAYARKRYLVVAKAYLTKHWEQEE